MMDIGCVPLHDSSQVNGHCSTKTAEIKKLGLNYIAPDFEVTIHDLDSFDRGSRDTRLLQMRAVSIPRQQKRRVPALELYSDRARLRTTHKAKEFFTRAGVIADHTEQATGGQRGSERVHTA